MAQNRKRPQYIVKQLHEINDILRATRMKYEDRFTNPLFGWFTDYLLHNGWYHGFNMYYDKEVTYSDGSTNVIRALAGPEYENYDHYIQIL